MSKRARRLTQHHGWRSLVAVTLGLLGFVAGVYTVVVLGGDALTGDSGSPSLLLSIVATTIVALSFARVQAGLERLAAKMGLSGAVTPYEVLSQFSEAVTGTLTPAETPERMAKILTEGTGALWAQVWLVVDDDLVLAAAWPPEGEAGSDAPDARRQTSAVTPDGQRTLPVRHGGQTLGLLRLQERPGLALTTVEERLFAGLAAQAGAVLRLAGLQAQLLDRHDELVRQAAELRASRQRLILAQDVERRRLERDMHDGAQQHLVALAVNFRLAQSLAERFPDRAAEVLALQVDASVEAISTLTEMSRGIYPRLLADRGLRPALQSAVAASAVPVTVGVGDPGRLPVAVEAALYFCALEAVQNATKHAAADLVTVDLGQDEASWQLRVSDDGAGFDLPEVSASAGGNGLLNMSDRLSAVGGSVCVTSRLGGGTTVTALVARTARPAQAVAGQLVHGELS
jgi:signal transduction histidine kinase